MIWLRQRKTRKRHPRKDKSSEAKHAPVPATVFERLTSSDRYPAAWDMCVAQYETSLMEPGNRRVGMMTRTRIRGEPFVVKFMGLQKQTLRPSGLRSGSCAESAGPNPGTNPSFKNGTLFLGTDRC